MYNNKSAVPEFPIFPMIVPLYDSSISDTYSFVFASQSMMVTTSSKEKLKVINKINFYLYPRGLLFGTNIMISRIVVLFDFMQSYHSYSYIF